MKAKKLIAVFGLCLGLAACSEQGVVDPTSAAKGSSQEESSMTFSMKVGNQSRADKALQEVNMNFGVWGYKNVASDGSITTDNNTVMENYLVGYANTGGYHYGSVDGSATTSHSTSDTYGDAEGTQKGSSLWVYQGLGWDDYLCGADGYIKSSISANKNQYLKYWDLSAKYGSCAKVRG